MTALRLGLAQIEFLELSRRLLAHDFRFRILIHRLSQRFRLSCDQFELLHDSNWMSLGEHEDLFYFFDALLRGLSHFIKLVEGNSATDLILSQPELGETIFLEAL